MSTDIRFKDGSFLLTDGYVKAWGKSGNGPGVFQPATKLEAEKMALAFQMAAVHLREIGAKLPEEAPE